MAIVALAAVAFAIAAYFAASDARSKLADSETALGLSRAKLEMIEIVAEVGFWEVDVAANAVTWSDHVFDIHRRALHSGPPALEEAIGYYHPDDRPMVAEAVGKAMRDGDDFDFHARVIDETGDTHQVIARGTPRFADGQVSGIFGVFIDLTAPAARGFGARDRAQEPATVD